MEQKTMKKVGFSVKLVENLGEELARRYHLPVTKKQSNLQNERVSPQKVVFDSQFNEEAFQKDLELMQPKEMFEKEQQEGERSSILHEKEDEDDELKKLRSVKYWPNSSFNLFMVPETKYSVFWQPEPILDSMVVICEEIQFDYFKKMQQSLVNITSQIVSQNNDTLLHLCARYARFEMFKYIYENTHLDMNCQNQAGETPFMIAAREGHLKFITELNNQYGRQKRSDFCKIDFDLMSSDGWTAFHYAAINGYTKIVEFLALVPQVDIYAVDRFKRNACHWASRFNNEIMVKKLLELGLDPTKTDVESQSCRNLATAYMSLDALKVIMHHEQNSKESNLAERESRVKKLKKV